MKRSRVCLAVAVLGCCFVAAAKTPPSSRPDASDTAHALFLKRMDEKGVELGLEASYCEDALYSMMLPSSNTLAESVATGAGEFILKDFEKGSER